MAMTACYSSYAAGVSQHQQQPNQVQLIPLAVHQSRLSAATTSQKDYSIPLHVDCSVEYELPNQAKPPPGARVEPLLMIHPCYFRKMESQRRSPFVNNMPNSTRNTSASVSMSNSNSTALTSRKSNRGSQMPCSSQHTQQPNIQQSQQQQQQQQQQQHQQQQQQQQQQPTQQPQQNQHIHQQLSQHIQQQQMSQMSQQAHYPAPQHQQQQQQPASAVQYIEQARRAVITRNRTQNQNTLQIPSGWDHQIPSIPSDNNSMSNMVGMTATTGQSMYSKPVSKRDAMMSSGCSLYSNSNGNNSVSTDIRLCAGRWEPGNSPMAAIHPDATSIISSRDDKLQVLNGKYRQYLRSQRIHPYLMSAGGSGAAFPQLTTPAFQQMQQVSCYNV